MNIKLKRSLAILLPVLGIAAVGAVGAQVLVDPTGAPSVLTNERLADLIGQPAYDSNHALIGTVTDVVAANASGEPAVAVVLTPAGDRISVPVNELGQVVTDAPMVIASNDRIVVAQAEPIVVAQYTAPNVVRIASPAIEMQRTVSPRSGENSGEEIATRNAPVDIRAGLFPQYLTDQSPGT
jgi:PRC-barrel domain